MQELFHPNSHKIFELFLCIYHNSNQASVRVSALSIVFRQFFIPYENYPTNIIKVQELKTKRPSLICIYSWFLCLCTENVYFSFTLLHFYAIISISYSQGSPFLCWYSVCVCVFILSLAIGYIFVFFKKTLEIRLILWYNKQVLENHLVFDHTESCPSWPKEHDWKSCKR